MSWRLVITFTGDEPSESEVEEMEANIAELLDRFDIDCEDVSAQ